MLDVFPDVDELFLHRSSATGFSIGVGGEDLFPAFLLLLGYLLPLGMIAFYLLRSREIAGAT